MYDSRMFSDSYDLYRPTITTSDTGEQTVTEPGTATSAGLRCLFRPKGAQVTGITEIGMDGDYDALLLVPATQTIYPDGKNTQPDHVKVGERYFVVQKVWNAANQGLFKIVLLTERR